MRAMASIGITVVLLGAGCSNSEADTAGQTGRGSARVVERDDIVSDQPGAMTTDPTLVNAWGLAFNPRGVAWVSAAGDGSSKVYDASGGDVIPPVTIPGPDGDAGSPTGQVFNPDDTAFEGDTFIFVTEEGTVAGWQQSDGDEAVLRVDNSESDAIYKGVTIATTEDGEALLLAADFFNARIDVFDGTYEPVTALDFSDPDLPDGYAPFNVEALEGSLIVTYAEQDEDKEEDVKGAGRGYVDLYSLDGSLSARLISEGELDAPWGVTVAPDTFTAAPNRLLIGNFGDGLIHAYSLDLSEPSATLEGPLRDSTGDVLSIDGLWAIEFGVDRGGFDASTLYFAAGPDDETHGVFGALTSTSLRGGGSGSSGSSGGY